MQRRPLLQPIAGINIADVGFAFQKYRHNHEVPVATSRSGGKKVGRDGATGRFVSGKKAKSATSASFVNAGKGRVTAMSPRGTGEPATSVPAPMGGRRRIADDSLAGAASGVGNVTRPGLRTSLANRVHRWLAESLETMSDDEILRLVEAQSPAETVAELLVAVPEMRRKSEADWTELLLRGAEAKAQVAELAGGLLSPLQAAQVLKISVPGVKQRLDRRKLLAVPLPGGRRGFPARQFEEDGRVREGVAEVAAVGADVDSWALLSILVDEVEDAAGGTLLERLNEAAVRADVLGRLASYGVQGAA